MIAALQAELQHLRTEQAETEAAFKAKRLDPDHNEPPKRALGPWNSPLYLVQPGDSLSKIAANIYGDPNAIDQLLRLNPEIDPERLRVGQRLILHAGDTGDNPPKREPGLTTMANPRSKAEPQNLGSVNSQSETLEGIANLVTRCIELRGEVKIAQIEVEQLAANGELGRSKKFDLQIASVRLDTKRDQHKAISTMLKGHLKRAEDELKTVRTLFKRGYVSRTEVQRVEDRIDLLKRGLR